MNIKVEYKGEIFEGEALTSYEADKKLNEGETVVRIVNKNYCGEFRKKDGDYYYKPLGYSDFLKMGTYAFNVCNNGDSFIIKKHFPTKKIFIRDLNRNPKSGESIFFNNVSYKVIEVFDDVVALSKESAEYNNNKTLKENFSALYTINSIKNFYVLEKKDVVNVLGKSYIKEELEKVLKTIKTID